MLRPLGFRGDPGGLFCLDDPDENSIMLTMKRKSFFRALAGLAFLPFLPFKAKANPIVQFDIAKVQKNFQTCLENGFPCYESREQKALFKFSWAKAMAGIPPEPDSRTFFGGETTHKIEYGGFLETPPFEMDEEAKNLEWLRDADSEEVIFCEGHAHLLMTRHWLGAVPGVHERMGNLLTDEDRAKMLQIARGLSSAREF